MNANQCGSRKDLTSQVSDKITPDSQKSYTDKASENVSGAYDQVAGAVQPGMLVVTIDCDCTILMSLY